MPETIRVILLVPLISGLCSAIGTAIVQAVIRYREAKSHSSLEVLEKLDQMDIKFDQLEARVTTLDNKSDMRNAAQARIRIRRFADEMLEGRKHSKDAWDICMTDCATYEEYCSGHPAFKNGILNETVSYIKQEYQDRLKKHDFLQPSVSGGLF